MSLFRDISHIKTIAALVDSKDISEDACRLILADMELQLRLLIKESFKFTKVFNKETLTDNEVNCALENLSMSHKMIGLRNPYHNHYVYNEDTKWTLDNKVLVISEQMKEVQYEHFMNRHPIELDLDWVSVNGNLVDSSENKNTISLLDGKKKLIQQQSIASENESIMPILKEPTPNILSKEADKFLHSFFRILKDNLEDTPRNPQSDTNFNRFCEGISKLYPVLNVMEKNPSLQILIPFIIHKIEQSYNSSENQSFSHKNLYLMVINSLNNNQWVNLEYHKHILLKILVYFLTGRPNDSSHSLETVDCRDEMLLRENAAKLLARLAER